MRFLSRIKLRSERGMALPLTILVMASTGAITVTVVNYSTSSGRTANIAKTRLNAQTVAEAGIANALAVLNNPAVPDPKVATLLPGPCTVPAGTPKTATMEGGTATYWGCYVGAPSYKWTLHSIGSVPNPTGGPPLTRKLTRVAQVRGLNDGSSVGAWNRMYHNSTTQCLRIEDVTIPHPIASRGDICLVGSGKITGAATTIEAGDDVIMTNETELDSTKLPVAGSGWTSSSNIVSNNSSYATTTVGLPRHGTLVNGSTYLSPSQVGSSVVDLDGTNDYVDLPDGSVDGLDDFTIAAWVRLDSTAAWRRLFDFGSGTNDYMYLAPTNGSNLRFAIRSGGGTEQVISGTALAINTWVHVAVTKTGSTGRLYVNGVQSGSSNTSMTLSPDDLGFTTQNWIGRSQYSADPYLNGRVDDFRIYERGLSTAEVVQVRDASTAPTGLVARYTFEQNANDSGPNVNPSATLLATSYGFAIPTGSQILGIEAWVERAASASGTVSDNEVRLLKAGVAVGSNFATSSTYGTSEYTAPYGDDDDLWGTTWTAEEINAANFGLHFKVDSNSITNRTAYVDAITLRVTYRPPPDTSIGLSGANILQAHIGDQCYFHTQAGHKPCTSTDKVYASTITTNPQGMEKPEIDMVWWYTNAKPGPKQACTTSTGTPPIWDNDSTYNWSIPADDNLSEVTPTNRSYTCQVRDVQNNLLGELSWNHVTHELTIFGTIFIDGDFRFDDNGQVSHYLGRGIIYAARDIEFDELVCAGGTGTASCVTQAGGMANWNPLVNMMTVLAGRNAEFDQGTGQTQPTPSGLQGLIYAGGNCLVHENFHLSGPIICEDIQLDPAANGWPTYYNWPALGSLVEGQSYGSPEDAAGYVVTAGDQMG